MKNLEIYKVIEGTDNWPLVDTIVKETAEECLAEADLIYAGDDYHWTNPS